MCSLPFSILFWGSHPESGNDDCFWGIEFNDPNEAMKQFFATPEDPSIEYIEIDGFTDEQLARLGLSRYRKNPIHIPSKRNRADRDEWQQERAMQAGMAFGCIAFNEEMGYE